MEFCQQCVDSTHTVSCRLSLKEGGQPERERERPIEQIDLHNWLSTKIVCTCESWSLSWRSNCSIGGPIKRKKLESHEIGTGLQVNKICVRRRNLIKEEEEQNSEN